MTNSSKNTHQIQSLIHWLNQRNWYLLFDSVEDFAKEVLKRTISQASLEDDKAIGDKELRQEAMRQISIRLHQMCVAQDAEESSKAFEVIDRFLVGLLRSKGRSSEMIGDITQQSLLEIKRSLGRTTSPEGFLAFCRTIAKRVAWRTLQRASKANTWQSLDEPLHHATDTSLADIVSDPVDFAEASTLRLLGIQLWQVILTSPKLTYRERQILQWHFQEGLSKREICRALKITPGTLYVALHRAIKKLRNEPTLTRWRDG